MLAVNGARAMQLLRLRACSGFETHVQLSASVSASRMQAYVQVSRQQQQWLFSMDTHHHAWHPHIYAKLNNLL